MRRALFADLSPQPDTAPAGAAALPSNAASAEARRRCAELLEATWRAHDPRRDLWVFGYASLLWRPDVQHVECRSARIFGFHRSFRMRSRVNRGTPECPGLVFALRPGGSCQGLALRVPRALARRELERLWQREMPLPAYEPRWLPCHTRRGIVPALAFTLPRSSPSYVGVLDDQTLLDILRQATGRYGTTLDYLLRTEAELQRHGIHDAEVRRIGQLARRHGLVP